MCVCQWRRRWCQTRAVERAAVGGAHGCSSSHGRKCRQGIGCNHACGCRWRRQWCLSTAGESAATTSLGVGELDGAVSLWQVERGLQSVEHLDAALVSDGSVDSRSAATTGVGVGGGGGDISRRQVTALQSVEHLYAALVTVGSVDSGLMLHYPIKWIGCHHVCECRWTRQQFQHSTWTQLWSATAVPQWIGRHHVCGCRWRRQWCQSIAAERAVFGGAHGHSSGLRRQCRQQIGCTLRV